MILQNMCHIYTLAQNQFFFFFGNIFVVVHSVLIYEKNNEFLNILLACLHNQHFLFIWHPIKKNVLCKRRKRKKKEKVVEPTASEQLRRALSVQNGKG